MRSMLALCSVQASPICQEIASSELDPPMRRPQTTDIVVRRILGQALQNKGLRNKVRCSPICGGLPPSNCGSVQNMRSVEAINKLEESASVLSKKTLNGSWKGITSQCLLERCCQQFGKLECPDTIRQFAVCLSSKEHNVSRKGSSI